MPPGTLLVLSLAAALAAGLGSLIGARPWAASHAVGWATAVAAGLMLGIGHVLLSVGQGMAPAATLFGAAAGLALMRLADGVSLAPAGAAVAARVSGPPATDLGLILGSVLHSAAEGVAIGAAAAVGAPLADFLLVTFALHNVSEGAVLGAGLTGRGRRAAPAAGMAVLARASQPLVAVPATLLLRAAPALLPWCLGASFGALLYLIVAELLPQSYRQVGRTGIAMVVSLAAGMVALIGGAP
jgi:ZIP family zinc transporter